MKINRCFFGLHDLQFEKTIIMAHSSKLVLIHKCSRCGVRRGQVVKAA